MPGTVKQFVDFSNNTNNDTGENTAASIQPIVNGETIDQTVLQRPSESLRQRTEAVRSVETDSLYLRDADRNLIIAGPGKVTWPGSTTVAQTGIPVLSDNLYIMPMLTPGFNQTPPVPPVASAFGTLHLKRASDSMDSIVVTSLRRSYAAGDQINVQVTPGGAFSCVLDTETGYRRTIKIVATGATTLSTVIAALAALTPAAPDNTFLVTAALEGGALGTDLLLTTQAKQYVSGNYDGEGHTLTPANLASFFVSNPTQALAEGDTLCINFPMVSDTLSTGGRRQALPENTNTAVPAAAYFNSRVHPENLVNAIPICKVVNGVLVFDTGAVVPAGAVAAPITGDASALNYGGGGNWADGTTNPSTTVEGQLDKIITDLAGATGTGKIQGSAVGSTDLAAGTLAAQITVLVQRALGYVTIGNGTTIYGDFNTNAYANSKLLLDAAIAALPATGGKIILKKGVALTNFATLSVSMPAGKTVEIVGDHADTPSTTPQLVFAAASEQLICNATGKLILRQLHIRVTTVAGSTAVALAAAPFEAYDVFLETTATAATGADVAMIQGTAINDVVMERVHVRSTALPNSANGRALGLKATGAATRIFIRQMRYDNTGGDGAGLIDLQDVRDDVVLEDIIWVQAGNLGAAGIVLGSTDNTTQIRNRAIRRYHAEGEYSLSITGTNPIAWLTIEDMHDATGAGMSSSGWSASTGAYVKFIRCYFSPSIQNFNGDFEDLQFTECTFKSLVNIGNSTGHHRDITFDRCKFQPTGSFLTTTIAGAEILGTLLVKDCSFKGVSYTNSADFAMFKVKTELGYSAEYVRFVGNTIDDFQNITYSGGDSTTSPRLFQVNADHWKLIECSRNVCSQVMAFTGGNTTRNAYLLKVTSGDGVTDITSTGAYVIRMLDNQCSDDTAASGCSNIGLLQCDHTVPDVVELVRNRLFIEYDTAGVVRWNTTGSMLHLFFPGAYAGTGKHGVTIRDNHFRIRQSIVATIANEMFYIQAIGVPVFQFFSFQRNHIASTNANGFNNSTAWGFYVQAPQYITCAVTENQTSWSTGNAPTQKFSVYHSTFNFAYFPSHAPPPAVNSAWDSNVYVHRGPV